MFFVERNESGDIIALHKESRHDLDECLSVADEEIRNFLDFNGNSAQLTDVLSLSDMETIRIIEDLVDLLIRKNIILFTELPVAAQDKLKARKNVRSQLSENQILLSEDEVI